LGRKEIAGNQQSKHGFTLIELVVTLAILAIMSTVAIMAMGPALRDARLRTGCRIIVAKMNYARSYAISHQATSRVMLDKTSGEVRLLVLRKDSDGTEALVPVSTSSGKITRLPKSVTIAGVQKPGVPEEENFVDFSDVGQSETAFITLEDATGVKKTILVDSLTGRCSVQGNPTSEAK
jgi:prepilin-type N-terminal cleavage/methylation domain-containing protein